MWRRKKGDGKVLGELDENVLGSDLKIAGGWLTINQCEFKELLFCVDEQQVAMDNNRLWEHD